MVFLKNEKRFVFKFFLTAAFLAFAVSCRHKNNSEEVIVPKPDEPEADTYFVSINPPENGIAGVHAPDEHIVLPQFSDYYRGVFIKDRIVKLSPYKIGKHEVSYELWKKVYDWAVGNGYFFAHKGQQGVTKNDGEKAPVTFISWFDCIVWCNAYTQMHFGNDSECIYRDKNDHGLVLKDSSYLPASPHTSPCYIPYADMSKKGFRLPTEAEWEFAARYKGNGKEPEHKENAVEHGAGVWLGRLDFAPGAFGSINDISETNIVAWFKDNSGGKSHEIGKLNPNASGLFDMGGNVWEWCFDGFHQKADMGDKHYKDGNVVVDPQGPFESDFPTGLGISRVKRGGSCLKHALFCSTGARSNNPPFIPKMLGTFQFNDLGFRLVTRNKEKI